MLYSIPNTADSTQEVIQRMIDGIQRMISVNNNNNNNDHSQQEPELRISSAAKRHFELEIERDITKRSKRCEGELREELLKLKERQRMSKKQLTC